MSPSTKRLVRLAVAIVALGALAFVGRGYFSEVGKLRSTPPGYVVAILGVYLVTRYVNAAVLSTGLRMLGHAVGVGESFLLTMVHSYANLLIPRAGIGIPATYLKVRRQVGLTEFASVQLFAMTLPQAAVAAAAGLAGLAVAGGAGAADDRTRLALAAVFAAGLVGAVAVAVGVGFVHPRGDGRLAARVRALTGPWRRMRTDWRGLGTICVVYAVVVLLRAFRLQLAFWALGADVGFAGALVASALADLAFIFSFTPSGLGFREWAIVASAGVMGVTPDASLAAALLDRIIWTAAVIVVAQYGFYRLIRPAGLPDAPAAAPAEAVR